MKKGRVLITFAKNSALNGVIGTYICSKTVPPEGIHSTFDVRFILEYSCYLSFAVSITELTAPNTNTTTAVTSTWSGKTVVIIICFAVAVAAIMLVVFIILIRLRNSAYQRVC